jgi:hypothetical protein
MSKATWRQIEFLRNLGYQQGANLSNQEASEMIDRLLVQEEKFGNCPLQCPYCNTPIGKRPRGRKKCDKCGKPFWHICGKLYTEAGKNKRNIAEKERDHKEWLRQEHQNVKENIKDDWKDEQKFRREFKEKITIGYLIRIGPNCLHAMHLQGLLVMLEDAKENPDMLPPYDECQRDTCECEYESVSASEVPKGTRVAELVGSTPEQKKRSGCLGFVLIGTFILTSYTLW